jgi:hypothetical protein
MRILKLSWLGLIPLFMVVFFACKKDAKLPGVTSGATAALPTVTGLQCCVSDYASTLATLYTCSDAAAGDLNITAQNDANSITVTINRIAGTEQANKFSRVTWVATQGDNVITGNTEGFENAPKSSYSFVIQKSDLSNLLSCAQYSIHITIDGMEGYEALRTCLNQAPGGTNTEGRFDGTFNYTVKTICISTPPSACTGIRTQTLGYWASSPTGKKYLSANWATVGSVTIGCATNTLLYSTQTAVSTAVGNTNTPALYPALSTFSAQLLTLSINLKFWSNTGNLTVTSGTFAGMTVNQVKDLANNVYGKCNSVYTASQMTSILDAINKCYDNGIDNGSGILACNQQ